MQDSLCMKQCRQTSLNVLHYAAVCARARAWPVHQFLGRGEAPIDRLDLTTKSTFQGHDGTSQTLDGFDRGLQERSVTL